MAAPGRWVLLLMTLPLTPGRAQAIARCPSVAIRPDSTLPQAQAVREFLGRNGYLVRCITYSKMEGTAQLRDVAGFQTDQGTFTVFFIPSGEDVQVTEERVTSGRLRGYYRYTFTRTASGHVHHYAITVNGPEYYVRYHDWLLLVWDATLADVLRRTGNGE